jgi:hypothetical protein
MGNRGASLLIGAVAAIVVGAGAAVRYRQVHQSPTALVASPSAAPAVIFSTSVETASASTGPLLFDSSAQPAAANVTPAAFQLVVPGFHDISAGGQPPRQLRGYSTTF